MNKSYKFLLFFGFAILLTSCKDKESPEITIVAPAVDAHFTQGTFFQYEIKVTDDRGLSQIREYIGDVNGVASTEIVSSGTTSPKGKRAKKHTSSTGFDLSNGVTGEFYIWVEAADHDGKSMKASRRFFVDP
tara:strand:- start:10828 stop:11223 length:396 start_codon:yes stop_codon:yes gene_type:complete